MSDRDGRIAATSTPRQVRLNLEKLLRALAWSLFGFLVIAVIGVAIPKIWPIPVVQQAWTWSWLGGATAGAIVVGTLWTVLYGYSKIDAAVELDRRFGLKERVSSTLSLRLEELESQAGQALLLDASRRVQQIEVGERFRVQGHWWNLLPLIPAALAFVLTMFVPNAVTESSDVTASVLKDEKPVKTTTDELRKKLAVRRKQAEEAGLQEAQMVKQVEKAISEMQKLKDLDRKQAMVKLNDLADEIRQRKKEMGDASQLKKQLTRLKTLQAGPAQKMANALKQGNFDVAIKELNQLRAKIKTGELTDEQKQALKSQLKQLAEKMQQMVAAGQQAKADLKEEMDRLKQQGDLAKAGELQNKLDQLSQSGQMERMRKMAEQLGKAAQSMSSQQLAEAAKQLESMAGELAEMAAEMSEMELLEGTMQQLEDAKMAMNCSECQGEGCSMCQGLGSMGGLSRQQGGMGMGEGRGQGDRPEAETKSNFYDSKVRGKIGRGNSVITGYASGPNLAGQSLEDVKQAIANTEHESENPLTAARLPRSQRKLAQEYFDQLRDGE